ATVQRARGVGPLGRHAAHLFAIHLLTALAVAHAQRARAGPAVGEERVDGVTPGDLAVDGGHLVGEIGREHAGLEEPGGFAVAARLAVAVALEPLGMRPQRFFPGVVAIHARHHADAMSAGRGRHLAEQVARAQELSAIHGLGPPGACGRVCYANARTSTTTPDAIVAKPDAVLARTGRLPP